MKTGIIFLLIDNYKIILPIIFFAVIFFIFIDGNRKQEKSVNKKDTHKIKYDPSQLDLTSSRIGALAIIIVIIIFLILYYSFR